MKNCLFCLSLIILVLVGQVYAQNIIEPEKNDIDFPEVPRISAYEAYTKYKAGKAIIIHAGGEKYERRHIIGAYNIEDQMDGISKGTVELPNFPMAGLEIFTYCY